MGGRGTVGQQKQKIFNGKNIPRVVIKAEIRQQHEGRQPLGGAAIYYGVIGLCRMKSVGLGGSNLHEFAARSANPMTRSPGLVTAFAPPPLRDEATFSWRTPPSSQS